MNNMSESLSFILGEEHSEKPFERRMDSDNYSLADFKDGPDKNLFAKTKLFWEFIDDTDRKSYNYYRVPLVSGCKNRTVILDRQTGKEKEMIMMGSCNYLGLSTHPKVIKAAIDAVEKYGIGSEGAALLSGTFDIHRQLEVKLARITGCEDAMVFPTGYAANSGSISALVRKGDVAIIDRLAHASIIDGCIMSEGSFRTFRHSNVESLEMTLERAKDNYNGKLIVVDGVYSMDGDIAPLPEIVEVARKYGARVMIDDAHATGVIGEGGRGTASHFGMEGEVDIVMGTLSKSLGALGGFVASSKEVINYIRYYARSGFFSINLPPAVVAATLGAIEVMETEPDIHRNLLRNIKYMKKHLEYIGFNVENTESAIIPILVGDNLLLRKIDKRLHEKGIYLSAIPYPAVPKGQSRFRLTVMATHTRDDMDEALKALEEVGREFGILGETSEIYEYEEELIAASIA